MNLDDQAVNVFTDGSSLPSPRRGGTGICIVTVDDAGHEVINSIQPQGYMGATNQQMELMACIQSLRELRGRYSPVDLTRFRKVVIWTDSQYVADNVYRATFVWPANRWLGAEGGPIVNAKLWKELTKEIHKVGKRVEIRWLKGHSSKHPHNKTADKLAKRSAKGVLQAPLEPMRVRRKLSEKPSVAGSIVPAGQRITIRVVTDRRLPVQRIYRYKIEVISSDSPYHGNVDDFSSDIMLSAGHTYEVQLNDNPKNPRIECLYSEIVAEAS
jgi:ribonuclease HI